MDLLLLALYFIGKSYSNNWYARQKQENNNPNLSNSSDLLSSNLSKLALIYQKAFPEGPKSVTYDFTDLSFTVTGEKDDKDEPINLILNSVSGSLRSGTLTAIMGTSGAGKTSLLRILLGLQKVNNGLLTINGEQVKFGSSFLKGIALVPQEDVMVEELSVFDNIYHYGRIRSPRNWTDLEVKELVNVIIEVLGLSKVKNSLVGNKLCGGISGGEKKRVSVAMALVTTPTMLFLDEPTTGLDAYNSLTVCNVLKELASKCGLIVCTVLHQPRIEVFEKIDELILLGQSGATVYSGRRKNVTGYFKKAFGITFFPDVNPADTIMDLINGNGQQGRIISSQEMQDEWKKHLTNTTPSKLSPSMDSPKISPLPSTTSTRTVDFSKDRKSLNILHQTKLCLHRSFKQQFRTFKSFILEIILSIASASLLGLAFKNDGNYLYRFIYVSPLTPLSSSTSEDTIFLLSLMSHLFIIISATASAVAVFGSERAIQNRESISCHSKLGYFLGKSLAALPRLTIAAFHFVSFMYPLVKPRAGFNEIFLIVTLEFFCVYGLSSAAAFLARPQNVARLATVFCLFAGVLCGYSPRLKEMAELNIAFIWKCSYALWSTEAFFGLEVGSYSGIYQVEQTANWKGFELLNFHNDIIYMLLLGISYRALAFLAYCWRSRT